MSSQSPLSAIALSLSGCGSPSSNRRIQPTSTDQHHSSAYHRLQRWDTSTAVNFLHQQGMEYRHWSRSTSPTPMSSRFPARQRHPEVPDAAVLRVFSLRWIYSVTPRRVSSRHSGAMQGLIAEARVSRRSRRCGAANSTSSSLQSMTTFDQGAVGWPAPRCNGRTSMLSAGQADRPSRATAVGGDRTRMLTADVTCGCLRFESVTLLGGLHNWRARAIRAADAG